MKQRGFTLLEALVATVIMAVAVSGLLSALSVSLRNAARLTDYDRAAMLARRKMDEMLTEVRLPRFTVFEGTWDAALAGGRPAGWRARVEPFEMPPGVGAGTRILDRLELEVWWMSGDQRRSFAIEGFRQSVLAPEQAAAAAASAAAAQANESQGKP